MVTKAFSTISQGNIYGSNVNITKLECTGHIQKRMGRQLMNLVSQHKNEVFIVDKDGKWLKGKKVANRSRSEKLYCGLGDRGRLTAKAIKSMQGHYGAAIRSNDNLRKMKEDIWKIFNHRKGDHKNCPSWCSSTRSDLEKANKSRLPFFCELMKPSFERLADDFLLSKCLHGGTQNANEAFHHLIWSECPKEAFCGRRRIELAVVAETTVFNERQHGTVDIFKAMGLTVGHHHVTYAAKTDHKCSIQAEHAIQDKTKSIRQSRNVEKWFGRLCCWNF